jgi:hypothetical protein
MPVITQLDSIEHDFHTLSSPPIFINDLIAHTEDDRHYIQRLISTEFTSDMISLLPSCQCGKTKSQYALGEICQYCGTEVKSSVEQDIETLVWFRKPDGCSKLISPVALIMLKDRFKKSGFSVIEWLMNTNYRPKVKSPDKILESILRAGIQRGFNYFIENFHNIVTFLFSLDAYKPKKWTDVVEDEDLKKLIYEQPDRIFSDYLPLPNKSILIIEKNSLGTYVDPIIIQAIDAILMLVGIDKDFYDKRSIVKQNRVATALCKLCEFYEAFFGQVQAKAGHFRRHLYGTRANYTFRAVITSITGDHDHEGIEVPWGVGLTAFEPHLLNKLLRYGFDLNSAKGMIYGHVRKYHPLLDRFLKELVSEARDGKIVILSGRNPTLLQGSILRGYISKFKTDPLDESIGFPVTLVRPPNADKG